MMRYVVSQNYKYNSDSFHSVVGEEGCVCASYCIVEVLNRICLQPPCTACYLLNNLVIFYLLWKIKGKLILMSSIYCVPLIIIL